MDTLARIKQLAAKEFSLEPEKLDAGGSLDSALASLLPAKNIAAANYDHQLHSKVPHFANLTCNIMDHFGTNAHANFSAERLSAQL